MGCRGLRLEDGRAADILWPFQVQIMLKNDASRTTKTISCPSSLAELLRVASGALGVWVCVWVGEGVCVWMGMQIN